MMDLSILEYRLSDSRRLDIEDLRREQRLKSGSGVLSGHIFKREGEVKRDNEVKDLARKRHVLKVLNFAGK